MGWKDIGDGRGVDCEAEKVWWEMSGLNINWGVGGAEQNRTKWFYIS